MRHQLTRLKHKVLRVAQKKAPGNFSYEDWIKEVEPKLWEKETLRHKPLISIIVPAFNTPDRYLIPLLDSVRGQLYDNWELCLVDASNDENRVKSIKKVASTDKRIKLKRLDKNYGIVGNTNEGIKMATGEFIAFLDHDDTLSPHALTEVALYINKNPASDLFYSDEDKLSEDGLKRSLPFFKPDWSPELLLGVNYITHFTVVRKPLAKKVGYLRAGYDGAQDYDFLLRVTEQTDKITHIPKILYHWRLAEGSTSKNVGEKNYADTAGQKALRGAVKRRGIKAEVIEIPERPTNYRLKFALPAKSPLVSIIIPFKDKADLLERCLASILELTTYSNYEIVLISNNSQEAKTEEYLKTMSDNSKIRLYEWNKPFNYAALNNFGRSKSKGDYLVLLNNDTEVITPDWIEELVGLASQPDIGAVGPLLHYPDQTIQHAGVVLGMLGMAGHVFRNRLPQEWTDFGMAVWPRNYLAVTGACLAVSKAKYDEVGGLDEEFVVAGNDVAFGISLYEKGYRNVFWPFAELIHYESQSVKSYQNAPESDYNHSLDYYRPYLNWKDPYFNTNLDLMYEAVRIRRDYEQST